MLRQIVYLLKPAFWIASILLISGSDAADPQPEQVHLAIADDAVKTMRVTWTTFDKASAPLVQWGPTADSLSSSSTNVEVDRFEWQPGGTVRFIHHALIDGLAPGNTIYYRVGSSSQGPWSSVFNFTVYKPGNPLRVAVFGDMGVYGGDNSTQALVASGLKGEFDLVIDVGDLAYDLHAQDGAVGDQYLRSLEPLIARVPFMVIAGNHEDDGKNFSHYQRRFYMPSGTRRDNQYYSFDLGWAHFIGISTELYGYYYEYGIEPVLTQFNWLTADLANSKAPWFIAFQHRPFYCSNDNSGECSAFENRLVRTGYVDMPGLEPTLVSTGLDLAFWGHEHSYERFWPVANRTLYNQGKDPYHNAAAPSYVITGAAGCHSFPADFGKPISPFSAARSNDYGYTLLTIKSDQELDVQQISVLQKGTVIDSFNLTKDKGHRPRLSADKRGATIQEDGTAMMELGCHARDLICVIEKLRRANDEM